MSANDKLESIENWRSGTVKIMVCTTAFGMGIEQSDVDTVMRIGCPPTIESMIQEFGRAGRDGRPAKGMSFSTCNLHHKFIVPNIYRDSFLSRKRFAACCFLEKI